MSYVKVLRHRYQPGDFKIEIRNWEISDNGVTALWGRSGSGKSSVVRLLLGLDQADELEWEFKGLEMHKLDIRERRLGVVFQNLDLFQHMTGRENVRFALDAGVRSRGLKKDEALERMDLLFRRLRISAVADRPVGLLSGGERQRFAVARALIGQPRMIFLDEPFSSLDEEARSEARELVREALTDANIPAVLITHDREDVRILAQSTVRMENGEFVSGLGLSEKIHQT